MVYHKMEAMIEGVQRSVPAIPLTRSHVHLLTTSIKNDKLMMPSIVSLLIPDSDANRGENGVI